MAQRGPNSDSDKLNPTHVTSSRALHHFDQRTRADLCGEDDDKLLDVVGPPQSPLLPMSMYIIPSQLQFFVIVGYFWMISHMKRFFLTKFRSLIAV